MMAETLEEVSLDMLSTRWNVWTSVLVVGFLAIPASGWTSATAGWRPAAPDPGEVTALEDISSWIGDVSADRVRGRYHLPEGVREAIRERSDSFELFLSYSDEQVRQERLQRLPFGDLISETANNVGIDGLLLASVVEAESNFTPDVVSPVGAVGLAQVMPYTVEGYTIVDLQTPEINLQLGANYLSYLMERFDGDLELVLAAYNAGPGAVRRFDGIPPYRETQRYVSKVLSIYMDHHQELWSESDALSLLQ